MQGAGDKLLARASLPADKDRGIGRCDCFDLLQHPTERGALPDDVARVVLGTDLLQSNPTFKQGSDPWSGAPLILVPAIAPDVTILHVQRADDEGRAHFWGTFGITREAALWETR